MEKKLQTFRLSKDCADYLDFLSNKLEVNKTAVIEIAVRSLVKDIADGKEPNKEVPGRPTAGLKK